MTWYGLWIPADQQWVRAPQAGDPILAFDDPMNAAISAAWHADYYDTDSIPMPLDTPRPALPGWEKKKVAK